MRFEVGLAHAAGVGRCAPHGAAQKEATQKEATQKEATQKEATQKEATQKEATQKNVMAARQGSRTSALMWE
jgi:hypothetical protein